MAHQLGCVPVLEELQRGGVLDPDLVVDDEMERIEDDRQETMDHQLEQQEVFAEAAPEEPSEPKERSEQSKTEQAAKVAQ